MVELKLFHKILIFIAVVISLLRLTDKFAPKSKKPKVDSRNVNNYYIPPVTPRNRPVERAPTPQPVVTRNVASYPVATNTVVIPYPEMERESSEVFYIRGLE